MTTPVKIALVSAVVAVVVALAGFASLVRRGLSTHEEPSVVEETAARMARRWAVPAELRNAANPVEATREVLDGARAHWADHCAVCHGNDGRGATTIGERMYPRAPDMTLPETQEMSDGEIFAVIENGIRLTGMPGWGDGTAESAYGSWALVHFIRQLPRLTAEDLSAMDALNPRTAAEWEELRAEQELREGRLSADRRDTTDQPPGHAH